MKIGDKVKILNVDSVTERLRNAHGTIIEIHPIKNDAICVIAVDEPKRPIIHQHIAYINAESLIKVEEPVVK